MDYLEGFLIGPVWSDTDYKSYRHFNAHLFLAFIMALAFAGVVFYPNQMNKWIIVSWPGSLIFLITLILITPFLSSYYYRLPIYVRPLVLLLYAFKYVLLFYVLTHFFLPLVTLDNQAIPMMLLERMDRHVNHMIDIIAESGGIFRTVFGIVVGTMWIVAEGLLLIIAVIATPLIAIGVLKGIQYVLDRIVNYVLYQPIDEGVPVRISERPTDTDVFETIARTSTQNIIPNADPNTDDMDLPLESPKPRKQHVVTEPRSELRARKQHAVTEPKSKLRRGEGRPSLWTSMTSKLRALKTEETHMEEEDEMYAPDFRGENVVSKFDEEPQHLPLPEAEEPMVVSKPDRVSNTLEFEDLMIQEVGDVLFDDYEEPKMASESDEEVLLDEIKEPRMNSGLGDVLFDDYEEPKMASESGDMHLEVYEKRNVAPDFDEELYPLPSEAEEQMIVQK